MTALSQWRTVLRLEWRQVWRERVVIGAAAVLALVVAAAVLIGASGHAEQRQAARALIDEHRALLDRSAAAADADLREHPRSDTEAVRGPRHPVQVLLRATDFRASLPPSPAAMLAGPGPRLFPDTYWMRAFDDEFVPAQPTAGDRALSGLVPERPVDAPDSLHRGRLSLVFVLVYIAPVLLLAVLYDVVSGERDFGTLRLGLAQPIRLRDWLATKVVARALPIWGAALAWPLCAVTVATLLSGEALSAARWAVWTATVGGYLTFWTASAVWVSAATRTPRQSALILAALYLVIVLVVPSTADLTARVLAPLPARVGVAEEERRARFEALGPVSGAQQALYDIVQARAPYVVGDEDAQARSSAALWTTPATMPRHPMIDGYLAWHGDLSSPAYHYQLRQVLHRVRGEYIEQQMSPLLREFQRQRDRQRAVVDAFAWLSPALQTALAIDEIAGASPPRHEHFLDQLDHYVRRWYDDLYALVRQNRPVPPQRLADQPPFVFTEESGADAARRVVPWVAGLFAAAGLTMLFATRHLSDIELTG